MSCGIGKGAPLGHAEFSHADEEIQYPEQLTASPSSLTNTPADTGCSGNIPVSSTAQITDSGAGDRMDWEA